MFCVSKLAQVSALAVTFLGWSSISKADEPAAVPAPPVKPAAAEQPKFTYYYFWRDNSQATTNGLQALKSCLAPHTSRAAYVEINVTDPAQQAVVSQFKVARSPMPLVLSVAPNGAVTGASTTPVNPAWIEQTLVTPRMTRCMKSMQSGKIVVLCVHGAEQAQTPRGVQEFVADPHFQQRTAVHAMQTTDPAELRFLKELGIPAQASQETTIVMMAPPGVLVGKFRGNVSSEMMATTLHAQGKCCNDPNCKHNRKAQ